MNITTKGRYALTIMLSLAQQPDQPLSLKAISEKSGVSMKYLESIASTLLKAGEIASVRGKNGGYFLTRKPEEYCVGDLLKLTEGSLAPVSCVEHGCPKAQNCMTLPLWVGLDRRIDAYLKGITLDDLLKGNIPE